ncbi:tyrosine-type recombinase/integrase [Pseudonocardia sp.]|uniref:tyrosine-type recombinase/integrase n=1 Tax=Pseudonocardia sp. TaxID=60912 RepID=UPI002602068D|nr:tyrosine-type recombinase/integrase [Pseudonocardia sp.]
MSAFGLEHLRRHALRHTGLTWMADAGAPVHVLRLIAGHGSLATPQLCPHTENEPGGRAHQMAILTCAIDATRCSASCCPATASS